MPADTRLDAAFDRLFAEHGPALRRLSRVYASSEADAEDLYQDICFALWRALPSFNGACSERTFLFRIGHNRGISHRSRMRLRRAEPLDDEQAVDTGPDPEAAASAAERKGRLLDTVRTLPAPLRDVVVLSLEGLPNTEIAAILGISESNVGVRLLRARRQLRHALGALEEP